MYYGRPLEQLIATAVHVHVNRREVVHGGMLLSTL